MEVFCFDKGNLLLINSFPCKQTTDHVYYLLYIWQQLNYNQEKDELHLTGKLEDKEELLKEDIDVRVVSMPSMELFEQQDAKYKDEILPHNVRARLSIEMASDFGWHKYVGLDGKTMSVNKFGASAPADIVIKNYGFTVENVVKNVKDIL